MHLADGDAVELDEAGCGRKLHVDELRVEALQICQHQELFDRCVVAHIAVEFWISIAPLFGGQAEKSDIEKIRLGGVGDSCLGGSDFGRNQVALNRIGVDAVIELRKGAIEVPSEGKTAVFVVLEALEFFDEVDFEFGADPHAEFEGDILVSIGAAIPAGACFEPDRSSVLNPFLHAEFVAVETDLAFNCGEFARIKIGVINGFPNPKKLDRITISKPVGDEEISILCLEHICQGDEVTVRRA